MLTTSLLLKNAVYFQNYVVTDNLSADRDPYASTDCLFLHFSHIFNYFALLIEKSTSDQPQTTLDANCICDLCGMPEVCILLR